MQNAAAVGDTATEQSLRIDLESLTSQQQTDAQMRAIDKAAEAGTKPLRAAVEAISNKQEKLSDSAALAGEGLDKLQARYEKQEAAIKKVNDSMTALYGNAAAAGQSIEEYVKKNKEAAAGFVAAVEAATGKKMPRYQERTTTEITASGPVTTTQRVAVSPEQNALSALAKSGTAAGVNEALASSIKGGATLRDIVNAVKNKDGSESRRDIKVTGDYSQNMETKTYDGKQASILNKDAKTQIGRRLDLKVGETFIFDGKRYRKTGTNDNAIVYVGPVDATASAVKKANGGIIRGAGTGTSDSIPALLSNGEFVINAKSSQAFGYGNLEKINRMAAGGRASRFNFDRQSFDVKNGTASSNSFVLNQNIYASEGMDVEALSNMIVKKAEVVIGQKAKINVKMVGQGKNI
jgi:hypothetical protein